MVFSCFLKKIRFWGILGPPSYGIGATICIVWEMLCLPYAGCFYSDKDNVEIPYITLGSKDSHFVIFEIKWLNTKEVLSKWEFLKYEIQRQIFEGGCPDCELSIKIDQFSVPKLEFTLQQSPSMRLAWLPSVIKGAGAYTYIFFFYPTIWVHNIYLLCCLDKNSALSILSLNKLSFIYLFIKYYSVHKLKTRSNK